MTTQILPKWQTKYKQCSNTRSSNFNQKGLQSMTRKRSRQTDSREYFNETHEPNTPPQSKKARSKNSSRNHQQSHQQNHQQQPDPQQMSIDQRLAAKRKRVQIHPKNLSQEQYLMELNNPKKQIVFAIGPAGTGKAQPLTSKIKIPGGWTTMGDIAVGDKVTTPDGNTANVVGLFPQGSKPTYSITLHDGRSTLACAEHLWEVFIDNKPAVINTLELLKLRYHGSIMPYIRLPKHEIMDDVELPIDPFQLGTMLLKDDKAIPAEYLNASRSQKVKLLQGLLDTSIHAVDSGNLVFTAGALLQDSVVYLVRSIGGSACIKDTGVHIRFSIIESPLELMPVLSVVEAEVEECQCILIDSEEHLYVTDNYIVSHNTLIATQWAVDQFKAGKCDKIIVTRPAVSNSESLGYLPGNLEEKMLPWTVGMFDVFYENWTKAEVEWLMSRDCISISPMSYMRGRTMKNACVIADEVQLCNPSQMKMLLTRIGDQSKMILTGDLAQADRGEFNGLKDFMGLYDKASVNKEESRIAIVRFSHSDIERHPAVAEVLKYYGED
jgi:phosphate starvation-inducible PhoH-like protein